MGAFLKLLKENFLAEKDRFILWLPVLFGLGIGLYFSFKTEPSSWLTIITVEVLLISLYVWRYNPVKFFISGALLIIALGFANIQIRSLYQAKFIQSPENKKETTYLSARVLKIDKNAKGKMRLLLSDAEDFEKQRKGLYRVTLSGHNPNIQEGNCVEMIATLMSPMQPIMPNSYQFNRKYFYDGLSAIGYANSSVFTIECKTNPSLAQKISHIINLLRKKVVKKIYAELTHDEASITAAILAGDRSGISQELNKNYQNSGLAHFLSISGLHMSMIAAMTFFAIRLIISLIPPLALKYDSKKIAAIFAIMMSFIYLIISGGQIPAQRAFIMTLIVLSGVLFSRRAISIRMLSIAALIVLIISPYALISASFQLSFAAVLVLIAFYEKYSSVIYNFFKGKNIIKIIIAYIVGLLLSDFVASIATLAFAIYHFNKIAIYTTLGNLLAGPIIGLIIMPFVLLSLFLMPFNLYTFPLKIVGLGIKLVNNITSYISSLPNAGYQVLSMPFWGLMLIIFGGLWLCIWQRKWRLWGIIPIIIGGLSIFFVVKPDFIYSADGKNIAIKDNFGNIIVIQSRKNNFIEQIWLEKTAEEKLTDAQSKKIKDIYKGITSDKHWIDLNCNNEECIYKNNIIWDKKGKIFISGKDGNINNDSGGVIYFSNDGKIKIKTIRSVIGNRLWN